MNLRLNKNRFVSLLFAVSVFISCGESSGPSDDQSRKQSSNLSKDLNSGEVDSIDILGGDISFLAALTPKQLLELPIEELQKLETDLESRNTSERNEMKKLYAINRDLCKRLQSMRSQCVASVRLVPDGREKMLACEGTRSEAGLIKRTLKVSINVPGQYQLIANKNIISETFSQGDTEITFDGLEGYSSRIIDIAEWRLVKLDEGDIASPKQPNSEEPNPSFGFKFVVGEEEIFNTRHLEFSNSDDKSFLRISAIQIAEHRKEEKCNVETLEINKIKREAKP